jgi:ATP-dependent DNA ligase
VKFRKPMSAKNYAKNEHRVEFPCYAQPKLDGIRCVTDGKRFWSRNGKLFPAVNMAHLTLGRRLDYLVDGELMIPDGLFEDIVSAVKHASNDDRSSAETLRFCVFDIIRSGTFDDRLGWMWNTFRSAKAYGAKWNLVPTTRIHSADHLEIYAKQMLKKGHEGTMVRNAAGLYVSKRSYDLLKLKPLLDGEFVIDDVKEAKGKDAGTPIFICRVGEHKFRARPMGSMAQRRRMWADRKKLIGKKLTVEYQNLTKHGVPRFPRAKVLRDYE